MGIIIKLIVFLVVSLFLFVIVICTKGEGDTNTLSKVYQGPVPEGYDEQHFRETGITKPIEENNGN